MFLLTMPALKKIISTFVYTTDVEPPIACVTSYNVICNPIVFTASFTLPILLFTFCVSIIVFCFFFCGWFFRWYILPVSLSATSSNATTSLSNSASCPYSTALFFLLFFAAFLCSRSCFLFCLASSVCFFLKLFRRTLERGCHFLTGIILLQLEVIFVLADSFLVWQRNYINWQAWLQLLQVSCCALGMFDLRLEQEVVG